MCISDLVLAPAVQAIKHLHDNQLVHLDIKPENIFVMREGYCKLGDFGLVMDLSGSVSAVLLINVVTLAQLAW